MPLRPVCPGCRALLRIDPAPAESWPPLFFPFMVWIACTLFGHSITHFFVLENRITASAQIIFTQALLGFPLPDPNHALGEDPG